MKSASRIRQIGQCLWGSILGFEASVKYASLPAGKTSLMMADYCCTRFDEIVYTNPICCPLPTGESPFVTVVAASEEPVFDTVDGVLTISTGTCEGSLPGTGVQESSNDPPPTVSKSGEEEEIEEESFAFKSTTSSLSMMTTGLVEAWVHEPG